MLFGLTASQWGKLALLLAKATNWAMTKVDQKTWQQEGYDKAMREQTAAMNEWIANANAVREETSKMTDAQITDDLDKNGELRKD